MDGRQISFIERILTIKNQIAELEDQANKVWLDTTDKDKYRFYSEVEAALSTCEEALGSFCLPESEDYFGMANFFDAAIFKAKEVKPEGKIHSVSLLESYERKERIEDALFSVKHTDKDGKEGEIIIYVYFTTEGLKAEIR